MVVDFSKAQIFKRKVPQASHGGIGRNLALAHFFKQFADGFGVQEDTQQSALGIER